MGNPINFLDSFFIHRKLPSLCKVATSPLNQDFNLTSSNSIEFSLENGVQITEDLTEYLRLEKNDIDASTSFISLKQYHGFLINFNEVKNVDEYLNGQFGKTSRYKLRRNKKNWNRVLTSNTKRTLGRFPKAPMI